MSNSIVGTWKVRVWWYGEDLGRETWVVEADGLVKRPLLEERWEQSGEGRYTVRSQSAGALELDLRIEGDRIEAWTDGIRTVAGQRVPKEVLGQDSLGTESGEGDEQIPYEGDPILGVWWSKDAPRRRRLVFAPNGLVRENEQQWSWKPGEQDGHYNSGVRVRWRLTEDGELIDEFGKPYRLTRSLRSYYDIQVEWLVTLQDDSIRGSYLTSGKWRLIDRVVRGEKFDGSLFCGWENRGVQWDVSDYRAGRFLVTCGQLDLSLQLVIEDGRLSIRDQSGRWLGSGSFSGPRISGPEQTQRISQSSRQRFNKAREERLKNPDPQDPVVGIWFRPPAGTRWAFDASGQVFQGPQAGIWHREGEGSYRLSFPDDAGWTAKLRGKELHFYWRNEHKESARFQRGLNELKLHPSAQVEANRAHHGDREREHPYLK
jgi:hypothetical protein